MPHATTPIDIDRLQLELLHHPDQNFVQYLSSGLRHGFDTMVQKTQLPTKECKNLLSASKQPNIVDQLLAKECAKGFMLGPFPSPPFPNYRVSPIGIAEGKYSKRRDLSLTCPPPMTITLMQV